MKSRNKFTLTLIILITLLSTGYVKAMYLWSVDVESGQVTCKAAGLEYEDSGSDTARLSPDRKKILAWNIINDDRLIVKKLDGTIIKFLPDDYNYADWSNDGQKIVASAISYLTIFSVNESIEERISTAGLYPRWALNGNWIACQVLNKDNRTLDIISSDGKKRKTLMNLADKQHLTEMEWSSDSKLLAIGLLEKGIRQLKIIDVDNGNIIFTVDNLYYAVTPQWSPKKRQIAYIRDKKPVLWVTDIARGITKDFYLHKYYNAHIRWSPDGKHIAVMDEGYSDKTVIFVVDVENQSKMKLSSTKGVEYLVGWSSDGQKIYYLSKESPFQLSVRGNVNRVLDIVISLYRNDRYEEAAELLDSALMEYARVYGVPGFAGLYKWSGDFPSLITHMKELYRNKDEDFFSAAWKADNLLEEALELKLDRGEKIGYFEEELPTPASAEDMFSPAMESQSIEEEVREFAQREHPNDSRMQQYVYKKQMSAYRYMLNVTDLEVKEIATREYPKDYSMQKYTYDKQLSAKRSMKTVADKEVKKIATREYPKDYSMQKYTYDRQLSAKQYMEAIPNSNAKSRAQKEYPNDYVMQKYTYDKIISR